MTNNSAPVCTFIAVRGCAFIKSLAKLDLWPVSSLDGRCTKSIFSGLEPLCQMIEREAETIAPPQRCAINECDCKGDWMMGLASITSDIMVHVNDMRGEAMIPCLRCVKDGHMLDARECVDH